MTTYEGCKEHVVSSAARLGFRLDATALEHILCQAERRGWKIAESELADLLARYGVKAEQPKVEVEQPAPVLAAQPLAPEPTPAAQPPSAEAAQAIDAMPLPPSPTERVRSAVKKAVKQVVKGSGRK